MFCYVSRYQMLLFYVHSYAGISIEVQKFLWGKKWAGNPGPGRPCPSLLFRRAKKVLDKFFKPKKMKPINKTNKEDIKKKQVTVKFSKAEYEKLKERATRAGTRPATYCREVSLTGFIMERPSTVDLNETRLLRQLLLEYRTNFARISNLIATSSPSLLMEVRQTMMLIQSTLQKHEL
jgi:hypothetical protein